MIDVLIAGGGPAGLAAAISAAKIGRKVVVVEPHEGPVDKACGEGIMPGGCVMLDKMGVDISEGHPFRGVRYHRKGVTAVGRFPGRGGIGIRRTLLSDAMWRRALELGVERRQGRVREVTQSPDRVRAFGLEARWLIAADGLHSMVRRAVNVPIVEVGNGRFGVRAHFQTSANPQFVDVHLGDAQEAYVTPVGDGLIGVAILSSQAASIESGLQQFPQLADELDTQVGTVLGAGPFGRYSAQLRVGRVLFVGDAAGFMDPITGEGVRLGIESAAAAVQAIADGRLDTYEREWRRITRRYRWVTSTLLGVRGNRYLNMAMVPVLQRVPRLFDGMLALLGGR